MMQHVIGAHKNDQEVNRRVGFKDRQEQGSAVAAGTKRLVMDGMPPRSPSATT
jgi:hypothetical protein